MSSIEERYWSITAKSAAAAKRAERVMPGGDTRSVQQYRPYSLTMVRGEGPFLFDADGNIGPGSKAFLQKWMDKFAAWVKQHAK